MGALAAQEEPRASRLPQVLELYTGWFLFYTPRLMRTQPLQNARTTAYPLFVLVSLI